MFSGGSGRPYLVEGVGEDFFPAAWEPELYDEVIADQRRGELPHRPPGVARSRASSSAVPAAWPSPPRSASPSGPRPTTSSWCSTPTPGRGYLSPRVRRRVDGQLRLRARVRAVRRRRARHPRRDGRPLLYVNPDQHGARGDRADAGQRHQPAAGVQEHAAVRRRRGVGLGRRARADGGDLPRPGGDGHAGREGDGPPSCRRSASARQLELAVEMLEAAPALLVLSGGRPLARAHPHRHPRRTSRRRPPRWTGPMGRASRRQSGCGVRDPRHPRRPGARRRDRRGRPADLAVDDVRPATRSACTRATSTRARATRPAPRSRACLASLEGGAPRARVRQRARRRGQRAAPARARASASLLGNDAYGGTFRLIAKVWAPLGFPWTAVDLTDVDALAADWPDDTGDGVAGDADQPAADVHRHRGRRRRSPTPAVRSSSSTTRSPRRTCSSRSRSAPTSSCTRPRSTSAATATWSAGSSPSTTTSSPTACASPRTRPARCRRRSTATSCCAA